MKDFTGRKVVYLDDAINVLKERLQANGCSNVALVSELNRSIGYLMQLPSTEPEQKKGEWINRNSILL